MLYDGGMVALTSWLASYAPEGPVEIFPDPSTVFETWDDELAARIAPVARFDLALLEDGRSGPATLLYYEDYAVSYLGWTVRDGKIADLAPDPRSFQPFEDWAGDDPGFLSLERYVVDVPKPSEIEAGHVGMKWAENYEEALKAKGATNPLSTLRLGGRHACYVQAQEIDDDSLIDAELPTSFLDLAPVYLYLRTADGISFTQEMQMT